MDMSVNLNKTKVVVFRKGGRLKIMNGGISMEKKLNVLILTNISGLRFPLGIPGAKQHLLWLNKV